eukprot:symbB.v1.2.005557.t2/scaffold258.1/size251559/11
MNQCRKMCSKLISPEAIRAYITGRQHYRCKQLLNLVGGRRINSAEIVFNAAINAYQLASEWHNALNCFSSMEGFGLTVEESAEVSLLAGFDKAGQWQSSIAHALQFPGASVVKRNEVINACGMSLEYMSRRKPYVKQTPSSQMHAMRIHAHGLLQSSPVGYGKVRAGNCTREHSLDTYHATLQAVRRDEIDYHAFSTAWQAAVQLLRSAQTAQLQGALRSKTLAFAVQVMKGPSHNKHVVES